MKLIKAGERVEVGINKSLVAMKGEKGVGGRTVGKSTSGGLMFGLGRSEEMGEVGVRAWRKGWRILYLMLGKGVVRSGDETLVSALTPGARWDGNMEWKYIGKLAFFFCDWVGSWICCVALLHAGLNLLHIMTPLSWWFIPLADSFQVGMTHILLLSRFVV